MPILETVDADSPLTQGDVFAGVPLFVSAATPDSQLQFKSTQATKLGHCLVLSRPCVCAHKPQIIVAGVVRADLPKVEKGSTTQLLDAMALLVKARDGDAEAKDTFYIGHLPGKASEGRFAAKLDSLHTIQLPGKPEDRVPFIRKYRICRMHSDFARDLHSRIFSAFASSGFDDYGWYSDEDLRWLIQLGDADLRQHELGKSKIQASAEVEGMAPSKVAEMLGKEDKAQDHRDTKEQLRLLTEEQDRRRRSAGAPSLPVAPISQEQVGGSMPKPNAN